MFAGAGESGKSTVLKQMRLIYAQGFSKSEKDEWRTIIFNNILGAFKVVLDAMDEMEMSFGNPDNSVSFAQRQHFWYYVPIQKSCGLWIIIYVLTLLRNTSI